MAPNYGSPGRKPAQVLAEVKRGEFAPVYVLLGADSAAADELLRALKLELIQPGLEAFDYESVHAEELEIPILLQHIRQPPVASVRRLVVVRGIDRLKTAPLKELLQGLSALPEECAAALTSDYTPELQRALAGVGLGKFVVDLRQPGDAELSALLQRRAKELGISLAPAAIESLLALSGDGTTLLLGEVEKLAAAVDEGEMVMPEDVQRLAGRSREFELNEYVNLVGRRDGARALAVLVRLQDWGEEPVKITAWLAGAFLRSLAVPNPQAEREEEWIRRCLLQLYEINRDIISGHPEPFALLEMLTVCSACPKSQEYCSIYADAEQPEQCVWRRVRRERTLTPATRVVSV